MALKYIRNFAVIVASAAMLFPVAGFAQSKIPHIEWAKCYGGQNDETALCIEQTADKGFIICGDSYSTDGDVTGHNGFANENEDYWIVKIDSLGKLEWERALGGDSDDVATSIKQTPDGGYIVVGYSNSINGDVTGNHGGKDYWVVKLDDNGKITWEKSYGGSNDDEASSIAISREDGYIITGTSYSSDGDVGVHEKGTIDSEICWVIKIDTVGKIQWTRQLNGEGRDVQSTSDGGYLVAEYLFPFVDFSNISKLDSAGVFHTVLVFSTYGKSQIFSLDVTSDHGFVNAGFSDTLVKLNHGAKDFLITKFGSASGDLQWQKFFGGSLDDEAISIQQTFDRGFIVAGITASNDGEVTGNHGGNDGTYDYWLVKLDSLGNLQWQKTLGGTGDDFGFCIRQTSDSGFIVAGSTASDDGDVIGSGYHFQQDYWIVKLGNHAKNDVNSSDGKNAPSICYPNPFSSETEIEFGTIVAAPSELIIYNVLGAEMRRIKIGEAAENIIIHRGTLPAGMYIFHRVVNRIIIEQGRMMVE